MTLDILKMILPFLGGGLAGALVNEWLRRRNSRIQVIPLIERVNRLVSPELKGITLARVTGALDDRRLEEIGKLREYQFTLRNTSTLHLQDAEVQFEFPVEDVEAWASRPALSKTAPVPVDPVVADPWKRGFRWRIPHLPSTDSIEFSFRAVNPPSEEYEVALYKTDRVVVEKSKGEPRTRKTFLGPFATQLGLVASAWFGLALATWFFVTDVPKDYNLTTLDEGGCSLGVTSSFDRLSPRRWPWNGPWQVSHRVFNAGAQKCVVESDQFVTSPTAILPGQELKRTVLTTSKPKLIQQRLALGTDGPTHKTQIVLYGELVGR